MEIDNIINYKKGWLVGNFQPSLIHSTDIEVGIHYHTSTDICDFHIHKTVTEYNIIAKGKLIVNNKTLSAGDIFIIKPYTISDVKFLEDTMLIVIKSPSITSDKFSVKFN